jgi:hypothetical protein
MAFSRRDFIKTADAIRTKTMVTVAGKAHYFDRRDKYIIALFMRDYFQAQDALFDGLAFLTACGF